MPEENEEETRARLRSDLRSGMDLLAASGDDREERRRALKLILSDLYSWREFECRKYGERRGVSRLKHLGGLADGGGDLVEGIVLWRDVAAHHPEQLVELRPLLLYPGEDLFPNEWLFSGENLCIVPFDEAPPRVRNDKTRSDTFRDRIAGRPLLPLLDQASTILDAIASG